MDVKAPDAIHTPGDPVWLLKHRLIEPTTIIVFSTYITDIEWENEKF